jgi:hypothetical protein
MDIKLRRPEIYVLVLLAMFFGNAVANASAIADCKSRQSIEENKQLADLKAKLDSMTDDQYKEEYRDIMRESGAVKQECERNPAFVAPAPPVDVD